MTEKELLPFCECGECGLRVTKPGNRFILGHNFRGVTRTFSPEHIAAISIGMENSDAVKAAAYARRGLPHTTEHNATMSEIMKNSAAAKAANDAQRGIPKTPEHIAAVINGMEEAGVHDKQRGGNDFVWHHVAYDFLRPKALRVRIIRKFHGQIHSSKGKGVHERGYSLID